MIENVKPEKIAEIEASVREYNELLDMICARANSIRADIAEACPIKVGDYVRIRGYWKQDDTIYRVRSVSGEVYLGEHRVQRQSGENPVAILRIHAQTKAMRDNKRHTSDAVRVYLDNIAGQIIEIVGKTDPETGEFVGIENE